jgi:phage replication-related protein YjqB (UPF0714/DUF867 family)
MELRVFDQLLAHEGVEEVLELRGRFGFMAYHGGGLEEMTDVIARAAAELSNASYYGVHQPVGMEWHIPSTKVAPEHSEKLTEFFANVDIVVTVHGYGRMGMWASLLLGGSNRDLAHHVGTHIRERLPAYDVRTDLDTIPQELRGLHPKNPVNLPRLGGAQLELPPRVRGTSPLFWDWEGPGLNPHSQGLVEALAAAARTFPLLG